MRLLPPAHPLLRLTIRVGDPLDRRIGDLTMNEPEPAGVIIGTPPRLYETDTSGAFARAMGQSTNRRHGVLASKPVGTETPDVSWENRLSIAIEEFSVYWCQMKADSNVPCVQWPAPMCPLMEQNGAQFLWDEIFCDSRTRR